MPTCCDCGREASKKFFSKSQLKKAPNKRRCASCANKLASTLDEKESFDLENVTCWICLEDVQTARNPIVRDCACRGTAGHVHLNCLVVSAKSKASVTSVCEEQMPSEVFDINNPNPWESCLMCKQVFNKLSRSCSELSEAVRSMYPCRHENPFWHKVSLEVNIARAEACGNINDNLIFAGTYVDVIKEQIYQNQRLHIRDICELCTAICKLSFSYYMKNDLSNMDALHYEIFDWTNTFDKEDEKSPVVQAVMLLHLKMRSLLMEGIGNLEEAITVQKQVVDTIELSGKTMEYSNELWRQGQLHAQSGQMECALNEMKMSAIIAEKLLGRDSVAMLRKKTELMVREKMMPGLNEWPAVCKCTMRYSHNGIMAGVEADIIHFYSRARIYVLRVKGSDNTDDIRVADAHSVLLPEGTYVKLLDDEMKKWSGRYGMVVGFGACRFGATYSVQIRRTNVMVDTAKCYAIRLSLACCSHRSSKK